MERFSENLKDVDSHSAFTFRVSELMIKTPKRRHWHRSGVFIDKFEYISHLVLVFLLLILNM